MLDVDEPEVAMARWRCVPRVGQVAWTARSIRSFALRHGMRSTACAPTMHAVSEVMEYASSSACPHDVDVEAASDGDWLTVIVRGCGHRDGDGASAHATAVSVADRVEWHAAGEDMAVVMEFRARGRDCWS